jgi:small subunit ribosomal protein S9
VARVRLYPGNGAVVINGKPVEEVITRASQRQDMLTPLTVTDGVSAYNVQALVKGGGISGWTGAVRLGIARALVAADESNRRPLRANGLLTRDPRVKERKKPGLKRARKAPQYTKR